MRNRRERLRDAVIFGLAAVSAVAPAYGFAKESRTLSLQEAIELAQRDSKAWAQFDARAQGAQAQVGAVNANWWPKISLDASVLLWSDESKINVVNKGKLGEDLKKDVGEIFKPVADKLGEEVVKALEGFATSTFGNLGRTLSGAIPESVMLKDDFTATFGAQVMMPLTPLFKVYQGSRLAGLSTDNIKVERSAKALEISYEVTDVYLKLVYAQLMTEVAQEAHDTIQKHVEMAEKYEAVGMISHSDVLSAKVEEVKARQNIVEAQNSTRLASLKLGQVLSIGRGVELRASDMPHDTYEITLDSLEHYQDRALEQRNELERLQIGQEAAERKKTIALLDYVPQVVLIGRYQYAYGIDALKPRNQAVIGLGMSWTIFDGLAAHYEAKRASFEAAELGSKEEEARELIELDVAQKYLSLSTALERVALTRQALDLADENLRTVTAQFANGESVNTDVLAAQARRTAARADDVKARIDILNAWAGLKLSVGESPNIPGEAFE